MRTVADWVIAALGVLALLVFAVFLWWFGPWHAPLAFGVWAFLSGPLLILAYRRTRSRWLLYLGSGLIPCGLFVALLAGDLWAWSGWGTWPATAMIAAAASLPLAITVVWLRRFMTKSQEPQQQVTVLTAVTAVACAAIMVGTVSWARADESQPIEQPTYAASFAGCYEVELGPWIPSVMLGHAAQGIVPTRIRLDTTRGKQSFEMSKLLIRPGWEDGNAYWLPISSERLELVWNNGFHGVGLNLRRRGTELQGKAVGHTDVSGFWPESRALVRARPTDCALVPADTVRMQKGR